jgi:hypothetical protein
MICSNKPVASSSSPISKHEIKIEGMHARARFAGYWCLANVDSLVRKACALTECFRSNAHALSP